MTLLDDPFDRTLRSWLVAEGSSAGAQEMHAKAIATVRDRRQRPTWLVALRSAHWDRLRRTARPSMPRVRTLIVLSALLVGILGLATVGSGGFRRDSGMFLPAPSATSAATSSTESATPGSTPRATPPLDMPAPFPSRAPVNETIVTYLAEHGQSVTPVPGAEPDDFALAALRATMPTGFATEYYAIVTCVDPSKDCGVVGTARIGAQRGVWFIDGNYIRAVDAVTLERILINGY